MSKPADERASVFMPGEVRVWLQRLAGPQPFPANERLAFRMELADRPRIRLASQRRLKSGEWGSPHPLSELRADEVMRGALGEADLAEVVDSVPWRAGGDLELKGRKGTRALALLLDTGRLFIVHRSRPIALRRGPAIAGTLGWSHDSLLQSPIVDVGDPALSLLSILPIHYLDLESGALGQVDTEVDASFALRWISGPRVRVADAEPLGRALMATGRKLPVPAPVALETVREPLCAVLTLREAPPDEWSPEPLRRAELTFRYGAYTLPPGEESADSFVVARREQRVEVMRDLQGERELSEAMEQAGFRPTSRYARGRVIEQWALPTTDDWLTFLLDGRRSLEARGIQIVIGAGFSLRVVDSSDWYTELESTEIEWFELDLGIRAGDERISLLPVLLSALRARRDVKRDFFAPLPDGRHVLVPYERIAPLAEMLLELAAMPASGERRPRLSRLRAMELAASLSEESATFAGLRALRSRLTAIGTLPAVAMPDSFRGTLRDYQAHGVAWLAALASAGLGAVLADDMGLGKTVQIIAWLCARRQHGGVDEPTLVVAPTSVLLSWTEQLETFAPHLEVLVWHGPERARDRARLRSSRVVLTTYALLHRDADELLAMQWDLCVLDEAQVIKNTRTVFASRARQLRARQRIALTGTPMENHLGELWSIVSYALPGALGSSAAFRAAYRLPIEKDGDGERLASLRRRLAPVLLRRTKEQVASELPPKTVIDHAIELADTQRDLYEAVRQMVVKSVRDAIASKGFGQSRITVLDALLKLRQICCDPRLLKARVARRTNASSKLEAFRELITTLVGEGRRILVFSQFVEMLALLREALDAMKVEWVELTGSTTDRPAVVRAFQNGTMPVFLISLKAGGTGLNLACADTVIHYDPWWNPAVEAQATDRAHRIGQTRPVFVHRLVARGTVEEKIVQLQAKKGALARGVLDGGFDAASLDEAAVEALLAPLPPAYERRPH